MLFIMYLTFNWFTYFVDCESVAAMWECVAFNISLPLPAGDVLIEIAELLYVRKLQGSRIPVTRSWWRHCKWRCVH